jgi:hypothetical protein
MELAPDDLEALRGANREESPRGATIGLIADFRPTFEQGLAVAVLTLERFASSCRVVTAWRQAMLATQARVTNNGGTHAAAFDLLCRRARLAFRRVRTDICFRVLLPSLPSLLPSPSPP